MLNKQWKINDQYVLTFIFMLLSGPLEPATTDKDQIQLL